MITLKQFLEAIDYRITEGSNYSWHCYGDNAHTLSAWNGINGRGGWGANIVFDTMNQTTYEVDVCDYTNDRAYRVINPDYISTNSAEAQDRGVDKDQAWDDVNFIDLDVEEDWLEKVSAIIAGKDYDTRVQISLELDDDLVVKLMHLAHKQDITLNQLVEQLLREVINNAKHQAGQNL